MTTEYFPLDSFDGSSKKNGSHAEDTPLMVSPTTETSSKPPRSMEVDYLRGLIIIIMGFDHTYSEFYGYRPGHYNWWRGSETWNTPAYWEGTSYEFFTRFWTHIVITGFELLMGCSMLLLYRARMKQGATKLQILNFFMIRGLLLIFLDMLLFGILALQWSNAVQWGTLSALGLNMFLGGFFLMLQQYLNEQFPSENYKLGDLMLWIPILLSIGLTELFVDLARKGYNPNPLFISHSYGGNNTGIEFDILDPPLAWTSCCFLGFLLVDWMKNYKNSLILSCVTFSLFFFFRLGWYYNSYNFGNLRQKISPDDMSVYIFFSICKYPPSFTFILWTLGWNFLFLWIFQHTQKFLTGNIMGEFLAVFGRSSLFYYIIHQYFLMLIALPFPAGVNTPQWIFLVWILLTIFLYPFCKWYGEFKSKTGPNSLWRLF